MRALTTANIINDSLLSQHRPGDLIGSSASSFFIVSADSLALEWILFFSVYISEVRKAVIDCIVLMTFKPLACLLVASFCSVSLEKCSTSVWVWIVKLPRAHTSKIHLVLPVVTLRKNTYSRALIGSKPVQENHFNGYLHGQFVGAPIWKNPYIYLSLTFFP